ncbi:alpha/beta hydrolase fold [Geosmithia morbida]|uniref:Alpha/beta hydrolase fold n=1 Tax=Geosmithia morbida TaxID=1094350 RepID=A0A9P4YXN6_9HYPO|nr:alpha/beta hydrolase fold [Geosmithia morbida]KAF4124755.1 alpha/beta hydrolase fold [Geosmithia morbida]
MAMFEDAETRFVTVGDIKFAYRQLGREYGVPLMLLMHFRGTMDDWDPALVDPLAQARPVLLIDNAGVGRSGGEVPKSLTTWAQHYVDVTSALGIQQVDVMGFSMGGCVAQLVALNAPRGMVRRLVLCGTTPSTGEGVTKAPLGPFNRLKAASTAAQHRNAFLDGFFTKSKRSRAAGIASWNRIADARQHRVAMTPNAVHRQAVAFARFMDPNMPHEGTYDRFQELTLPVLVANGCDDLLLPTENSILMWKMLRHAGAHLHLYPDSGHGFLYQYAGHFAKLINDFLEQPDERHTSSRL